MYFIIDFRKGLNWTLAAALPRFKIIVLPEQARNLLVKNVIIALENLKKS